MEGIYFSDDISDRQLATILHTVSFIGSKVEDISYNQELLFHR